MTAYWTVVISQPKNERLAQTNLVRQGYEVYFPMISRERLVRHKPVLETVPLFPRYLFVRVGLDRWSPIRSTRGVSNVLLFGSNPAKVSEEIVNSLKNHEIEFSRPKDLSPRFYSGQPVKVVSGSFLGHLGIFDHSTSKDRECILLKILGRETKVYVQASDLSAV